MAVLALPVVATLAQAATYYIATGGSDSHPCSEAQPCATLARATQGGGPGDTFYFRGGSYSEKLTAATGIPSGTSESQRTVVAGYPGETAVLTAGMSLYYAPGGPWLEYVTFAHLVIDGGDGYKPLGQLRYIRFQDSEVMHVRDGGAVGGGFGGKGTFGQHHMEYRRLHIHHNGFERGVVSAGDPGGHCVYICTPFLTFADNDIHDCGQYGLHIFNSNDPGCSDDSVIINNAIHDNQTGDGGAIINYGSRTRIMGNRVWNNRGDGIAVIYGQPDSVLLCGNTITDNTGAGISIGAGVQQTVLRGNTLARNSRDLDDRGTGTITEAGDDSTCPANPAPAPTPRARPTPRNLRVVTQP